MHTYTPLAEPIPVTEQSWPEGTLPMVSTSTITFNHIEYIRDCIEGLIMQKTTFPVQIIIFDDASTDGTREVVKEYVAKYPNLIKGIFPEKNTWGKPERIEAMEPRNKARNKAKYVALCEGDDYWNDSLKLQKQVDFMEANPKFSMCFHKVEILSTVEKMDRQFVYPKKDVVTFKNIIFKHYIPTCSLLFKTVFLPEPMPKWFNTSIVGDIPLEIMVSHNGPVKFISDEMGVYRKHYGGITMDKNRSKRVRIGLIKLYWNLNAYFNYRYWFLFSLMALKHYIGIVKDFVLK